MAAGRRRAVNNPSALPIPGADNRRAAGPMRTFTLTLVKDRLQGEILAELGGQSFTTKVDLGRAAAK